MKIRNRFVYSAIVVAILLPMEFYRPAQAFVQQEADGTYLVDRTGARWDITQARELGFDPHGFEFGIGRDAFRPLGEKDWDPVTFTPPKNMRVIGVAGDGDAHAYSVDKLRHHETANTTIGSRAIVAGY